MERERSCNTSDNIKAKDIGVMLRQETETQIDESTKESQTTTTISGAASNEVGCIGDMTGDDEKIHHVTDGAMTFEERIDVLEGIIREFRDQESVGHVNSGRAGDIMTEIEKIEWGLADVECMELCHDEDDVQGETDSNLERKDGEDEEATLIDDVQRETSPLERKEEGEDEEATLIDEEATLNDEEATLNDEEATLNDEEATLIDEVQRETSPLERKEEGEDEEATLIDEEATLNDEEATLNDDEVQRETSRLERRDEGKNEEATRELNDEGARNGGGEMKIEEGEKDAMEGGEKEGEDQRQDETEGRMQGGNGKLGDSGKQGRQGSPREAQMSDENIRDGKVYGSSVVEKCVNRLEREFSDDSLTDRMMGCEVSNAIACQSKDVTEDPSVPKESINIQAERQRIYAYCIAAKSSPLKRVQSTVGDESQDEQIAACDEKATMSECEDTCCDCRPLAERHSNDVNDLKSCTDIHTLFFSSVKRPSGEEVKMGDNSSPVTAFRNSTVLAEGVTVRDEMKQCQQTPHSHINDSGDNATASTRECELCDCNGVTLSTQPFIVHSTSLVQAGPLGLMETNGDMSCSVETDIDRAVCPRLHSGNMSLPHVGDSPVLNQRSVIESFDDTMKDCLDGNADIVSECQTRQPPPSHITLSSHQDRASLLLEEARTGVQSKVASKVEVTNDIGGVTSDAVEMDVVALNEDCWSYNDCNGRETDSTVETRTGPTLAQHTNGHQSLLSQHGDSELSTDQQSVSEPDNGLRVDIPSNTNDKLLHSYECSTMSDSLSDTPCSGSAGFQVGKFVIQDKLEAHDQLVPNDHMVIEQLTGAEDTSIGHGVVAEEKETERDCCLLSNNDDIGDREACMTWNYEVEDRQDEPQPKRMRKENTQSGGNPALSEPHSSKSAHDGLPTPCFPQIVRSEKSQCQTKRPRLRLGLSKRQKCHGLHRNRIY